MQVSSDDKKRNTTSVFLNSSYLCLSTTLHPVIIISIFNYYHWILQLLTPKSFFVSSLQLSCLFLSLSNFLCIMNCDWHWESQTQNNFRKDKNMPDSCSYDCSFSCYHEIIILPPWPSLSLLPVSHFTILLYKRCRPDYICWQERQEERQEGGVKICHYASCSTEVLLFLHPLFLSSFHLHFLYAWGGQWTVKA